jgi:hypothetical protein
MAIRDKPTSKDRRTDAKTEIAIARYEVLRKQAGGSPKKPSK